MSHIINIIEKNFYERVETSTRNLKNFKCINNDKIFIAVSGLNCDTFNIISKINNTKSLNEAIDYFVSRKLKFSCWVNPSANLDKIKKILTTKNLKQDEVNQAMYIDSLKINILELEHNEIKDFEIATVDNQQKLIHFSTVLAMNWNPLD